MNATEFAPTNVTVLGAATPFTQADIYGYARAVRAQLADQSPNIVAELTGGLEADLTEAAADPTLADRGGLDQIFGSPQAYAAELRRAAGLGLPLPGPAASAPDTAISALQAQQNRSATARSSRRALKREVRNARRVDRHQNWGSLRQRDFGPARERWNRAWAPLTNTPDWARFRAWTRELAPIWWALRGWIVGSFLVAAFADYGRGLGLLPRGTGFWFTLAVTVLSIQWGRRRWLPWRWLRGAATLLSAAALLLAIPMYLDSSEQPAQNNWASPAWSDGYNRGALDAVRALNGVWVDGVSVNNIFAFDGSGQPIDVVQLFDENGRAITTVTGEEQSVGIRGWFDETSARYRIARAADDGSARWNAFPLLEASDQDLRWTDDGSWTLAAGQAPRPAPWPFLRATPLADAAQLARSGTGSVPSE